MSGYRIGGNIVGSSNLQTSVANQEIIPINLNFYSFELLNDQDCHISINNEEPIFIRANQGLKTQEIDLLVFSIKIVENNITFNWCAKY